MAEQRSDQTPSRGETKSPKGGSGQANLGLYFAISLVSAIVVVAAAAGINHAWPILGTTSEEGGSAAVQNTPAPGIPTDVPIAEVDVDNDPSKGPTDAPVTIIEFSDFQCPYCARFAQETLPQILQNYSDKVRFVYRDYPLSQMHPHAQKAAEAGECAHEQGAFWEYHDLLFQNQTDLNDLYDNVTTQEELDAALQTAIEVMKGYAASLGLDSDRFNECLDSGKYADEVEEDLRDGQKAAIEVGKEGLGTPSFFINGMHVSGAYPYDTFKQIIDLVLAEGEE